MTEKIKLLDKNDIDNCLTRLSHEIVEKNNISNVAIIGIRTRGEIVAKRILEKIEKNTKQTLKYGVLDVTFHRDDFLTNLGSPEIGPSDISFDLNGLLEISFKWWTVEPTFGFRINYVSAPPVPAIPYI